MAAKPSLPYWTIIGPLASVVLLLLSSVFHGILFSILLAVALFVVVLAAVHHAELMAQKVGEPYGTLLLAVAITIIEVSIIVSLMIAGGPAASNYARDTVFSAIMIILTGIIGLCLVTGGIKFKEQSFIRQGTNAALVVLVAIITLSLILPNYTTTVTGPYYSKGQLIFVSVVSLVLYGSFIAVQTGRHRNYFLDSLSKDVVTEPTTKLSAQRSGLSLVLLLISLLAVVLMAKKLSPDIENFVAAIGAPQSLVGVIVALVILLPEGLAAFRAAQKNRLQTSLNLSLGSALASIGLTIPAVAIVSIINGFPITLGIDGKSTLLVLLSLFSITISFGTGRTNVLQGIVLLVLFAAYLFLTIVP
jgi:Ca2+:H+ antiporter